MTNRKKPNEILLQIRAVMSSQLYEYQDIRKHSYNRIRDILFRLDKGIGFNEKQDKKDDKEFLKEYADNKLRLKFSELYSKEKISPMCHNFLEKLFELVEDSLNKEKKFTGLIKKTIQEEMVWNEFLQYVKGIGPLSTAILLYYFGYCEKARYVSSLWKFSGYSVEDGKAPVLEKGKNLDYNPKLRMFMYRISDSFIKQRTPFYRGVYDSMKAKQVRLMESGLEKMNKEELKEFKGVKSRCKKREFMNRFCKRAPVSLLNAELRARRKMMKVFLEHYFVKCKRLLGVEESKPWHFEKEEGHKGYVDVDWLIENLKKERFLKEKS